MKSKRNMVATRKDFFKILFAWLMETIMYM